MSRRPRAYRRGGDESVSSRATPRAIPVWALVCALLASVLLPRLGWVDLVFSRDGVLLHANDAAYLARLARYQAATGLRHIEQDAFSGAPEGQFQHFPPLFPALASVPALLLGWGRPSPQLLAVVAALVPVGLALASGALIYACARVWIGARGAPWAAALALLSPSHLLASQLGVFDTSAAEAALFPAVLWAAGRLGEGDGALAMRRAGALLALCWLGMLTWFGTMVFIGVALAAVGMRTALRLWSPPAPSLATLAAPPLVCLALTVWLLPTAAWLYPHRWLSGDPYVLTWAFACTPLLMGVLYAAALALLLMLRRAGWAQAQALLAAAAATTALAALGFVLSADAGRQLLRGVGYVAKDNPWFEEVVEARPLFVLWTPWDALSRLGLAFYAQPLLLWPLWRAMRRDSEARARLGGLLLVHAFFFCAALNSVRWCIELSITLALWWGWALAEAWQYCRTLRWGNSPLWRGAVFAALILSTAGYLRDWRSDFLPPSPALRACCAWLRAATPPGGDPYAQESAPAYRVLAGWDLGHHLLYLAERAVVANPMISNTTGNLLASRFMLSEQRGEALEILHRVNARYVVTAHNGVQNLDRAARTLGRDGTAYVVRRRAGGRVETLAAGPRFWEVAATQLHLQDGAPTGTAEGPWETLRLVWESPPRSRMTGGPTADYKVFERVPGVVLRGQAAPGARVVLEAEIETNSGRRFGYARAAVADASGAYALRLPYATETSPRTACRAAAVVCRVGTREIRGEVSERSVLAGEVIELPPVE